VEHSLPLHTVYTCRALATPHEKGTALEAAVSAIESLILESSPAAKGKTCFIETRKRVESDGVQHEIDLHVTTEIAVGYRAIFIFECKNWKDKVDKNEIIVFSEKIRICSAQRGFFVAKSFTSDAIAQAQKDSRMILKTVTEHDPASTILPFAFHYSFQIPTAVTAGFRGRGGNHSIHHKLELSNSVATLDGTLVDLLQLINLWATEAINDSMRTFPSGTMPDGVYPHSCQSERHFDSGQLVVNGIDIERVTLEIAFHIHIKHPVVISHFEVEGRGRVITIEGHTIGAASIEKVQFIFGPEGS
jgi:Restriction endonuclease